jgi:DNA-3-methyladenine glycosylase I
VADDPRLFEKISLEGFQSGLSWRTILAKRDNFRHAFAGFDYDLVAALGRADVERLLQDRGIVRHRGKIEAVVNNARRAIDMRQEEGSLAAFFWRYAPPADAVRAPQSESSTPVSHALSKELKARGWKFVGPTTVFAFMQAAGLVNDHSLDCVTRDLVNARRAGFNPLSTTRWGYKQVL